MKSWTKPAVADDEDVAEEEEEVLKSIGDDVVAYVGENCLKTSQSSP